MEPRALLALRQARSCAKNRLLDRAEAENACRRPDETGRIIAGVWFAGPPAIEQSKALGRTGGGIRLPRESGGVCDRGRLLVIFKSGRHHIPKPQDVGGAPLLHIGCDAVTTSPTNHPTLRAAPKRASALNRREKIRSSHRIASPPAMPTRPRHLRSHLQHATSPLTSA